MATRKNNFKNVERRKQNAANRQAERNLLTPEQQLQKLDQKFGVGKGATRERKRLLDKLEVNKVA